VFDPRLCRCAWVERSCPRPELAEVARCGPRARRTSSLRRGSSTVRGRTSARQACDRAPAELLSQFPVHLNARRGSTNVAPDEVLAPRRSSRGRAWFSKSICGQHVHVAALGRRRGCGSRSRFNCRMAWRAPSSGRGMMRRRRRVGGSGRAGAGGLRRPCRSSCRARAGARR